MAINPATIDPLALPSVSLQERSQLPARSCIYFAIDSHGVVQYIGRTVNLKNRWSSHHCYGYLKRIGNVRIAYIEVSDHNLLAEIEDALISHFNPLLNTFQLWSKSYQNIPPGAVKIRRYTDIEISGLGGKIKQARKADGRSVEVLAGEADISRSYWHDIEAERIRDALPEDTLRKIERVLGIDLGVKFDD
ncbi:MAG: helix-turn-helix domain-containing protein [Nostoc sp. CmiVER01]|uniref:helix-turn-helix domain-containing protein n=1 Tax=Nostoc sp. CmiVER01 TaxID=3075384 RepID=UPI003A0FEFEF